MSRHPIERLKKKPIRPMQNIIPLFGIISRNNYHINNKNTYKDQLQELYTMTTAKPKMIHNLKFRTLERRRNIRAITFLYKIQNLVYVDHHHLIPHLNYCIPFSSTQNHADSFFTRSTCISILVQSSLAWIFLLQDQEKVTNGKDTKYDRWKKICHIISR